MEEGNRRDIEFTLLSLDKEFLAGSDEYDSGVPGDCERKKHIIQVDEGTLVNEVPKNIIHQGREDHWGVDEATGHNEVLEVPKGDVKCGLPFILLLNPD